jgi:hypothetical protein
VFVAASVQIRDAGRYAIELRFNQPESDADIRLVRGDPALVQFDMDRLRVLTLDDSAYGQLLSQSLFSDPSRPNRLRPGSQHGAGLGSISAPVAVHWPECAETTQPPLGDPT